MELKYLTTRYVSSISLKLNRRFDNNYQISNSCRLFYLLSWQKPPTYKRLEINSVQLTTYFINEIKLGR